MRDESLSGDSWLLRYDSVTGVALDIGSANGPSVSRMWVMDRGLLRSGSMNGLAVLLSEAILSSR